ncbi:hypothetical protein INT43_007815 [Umbelopsis isabellina]|uniref:SP-RING-type domain-containing protein n=1 Tax=Mortierella isabellina TaxID=91625 RepID=A0A8H7UEP7_MORIS|nr:hypothetical protein INT43_007815 [Umbelopsis isabellina]
MASTSSTRSAGIEPAANLMSEFELTVESTRKITSLLRNNEKISQNILLGMQLATDAACDAEEHQLQSEVSNLEGDLQKCIDIEAQFAGQEESLKQLNDSILEGQRITNMVEYCNAHRKQTEQQTASQRSKRPKYKEHDAYADFKQRIWDVNHKDEEMPSSGDEDGDDDIVIGRAKVSLRCPLTTVLFEDPVTSKLCKHSFSKHAIMQLLRQHGEPMPCPIPGCDQRISKDTLYKNHLLAQKVQRVKQLEAQKSKDNTEYHEVTD